MDNLFLSATLFDALKDQIIKPPLPFNLAYIFVNVLYPVRSISMCSSIYITVGLSFERYTFLVKPLHHRTRHNRNVFSRLLMYIISTVTLSLLYCIPKFLDLEIKKISINSVFDCLSNVHMSIFDSDRSPRRDYLGCLPICVSVCAL